MEPTLFTTSKPGARAAWFPKSKNHPSQKLRQALLRQKAPRLPEVEELDTVRHFTRLSQLNFSVDTNFYPLGSCTMKYNPKACFRFAQHAKFSNTHPLAPASNNQGLLAILKGLEDALLEITGMDALTLAPAAGAHAELTGILTTRAYFEDLKKTGRNKIIIPDSAHGTNPASAALGGYEIVTIRSNQRGRVSLDELKRVLDDKTALLMMTVPNTLGLFEDEILEVARLVHNAGALMYFDGANMNALMGVVKPGDLGCDMMHLNLHKTFSVPHGGGGPGAGVFLVKKHLEAYLPMPRIIKTQDSYQLQERAPKSIGRIRAFFGSVGNLLWAAGYIGLLGKEGLTQASRRAVINANYLRKTLSEAGLKPHIDEPCMHECVFTLDPKAFNGVRTTDIAKRLLDHGFHAPTIYFPLIVPEAIMVEPTETESQETLDAFTRTVGDILKEALRDPDKVKNAPHTLPVTRLDEVTAARKPVLKEPLNQ